MIKLRSRLARLCAAASGIALITSGLGLIATGSAQAQTTASPDYAIVVPVQTVDSYRAPLYNPSGQLVAKLSAGTTVEVTCYYAGNPPAPYLGDGYMDHVVWVEGRGDFTGHVPDRYVNLGGETPVEYGIPQCG
jgi:hypothetical protein